MRTEARLGPRLLLCLVALAALAALAALPAAEPTVSLGGSAAAVQVGGEIIVELHLAAAPPSTTVAQFLRFDPTRLRLVGQAPGQVGTFVPDSREPAAINASGEVRAGLFALAGFSGGGTTGTFRFRALSAGTTRIASAGWSDDEPFGALVSGPDHRTVPAIGAPLVVEIGGDGSLRRITIAVAPAAAGLEVELDPPEVDPGGDPSTGWWFDLLAPGLDYRIGFVLAPVRDN